MTTLSTGQEYNPTVIPKLKQKTGSFIKDKLSAARMGSAMFIAESVGDVLGEGIGSLAGSLLLPKEKKNKEEKEKLSPSDYLKIFKAEAKSLFSKSMPIQPKENKEDAKPATEKTNTKIVNTVSENNDIMLRVANATEMTEEASVEQVHVLEKISKSLESVDKKAPTKGEQEELAFEKVKKQPATPKLEQLTKEKDKGLFGTISSIIDSVKVGKTVIEAVSKVGPMLTTMGSAISTITPMLGAMATILGPAALGGFLGKMYQDWSDKKEIENSKLDKKEMIEKVNVSELSKLSDSGEWNKLKDTFTGKAGDKGRMQYLVEQKIENKQTFTPDEARLVKEKIGITVPTELVKSSVINENNKVIEQMPNSFQSNSIKEMTANTEKLSLKQDEKSQQPVIIAPTTNNQVTPQKTQIGQYTSLNMESTFRRLTDKLTINSIV